MLWSCCATRQRARARFAALISLLLLPLSLAASGCTDSPEVGDPDAFLDDASDLSGDGELERGDVAAVSAEALGCWSSGQCPTVHCPCSSGTIATRGCHDGLCAGRDACFGGPMSICREPEPDGQRTERGLTGTPCTGNVECASEVCIAASAGASHGTCSQPCASYADCPVDWACIKLIGAEQTWCAPRPH